MALWRYKTGRKGMNRVSVYERTPGGPIWIETWPTSEPRRETLTNLETRPITDRALAIQIADAVASKILERTRAEQVRTILGIEDPHTLEELLGTYHEKRGKRWSDGHTRHQVIHRDFWLIRLGSRTDVRRLNAADVEDTVAKEAMDRGWSPRTQAAYLKYLKTAMSYGRMKLKWFGEEHDLSAVDVPAADGVGLAYSTAEVRALLRALENVDLRAAAAAHIASVALRRIGAIRQLSVSTWTVETMTVESRKKRIGIIAFPKNTDKARKHAQVAVAGRGLALVEMLLQSAAVKATGLLFPDGDLHREVRDARSVSYEQMNAWLRDAENIADIEHIDGRGWHAFKRRTTTDSEEVMGSLNEAARQAGTLKDTLERVYLQQDIRGKARFAVRMSSWLAG